MSTAQSRRADLDLAIDSDFAALCARLGADPWYTQGAGGNASEKRGGVLTVKASGRRLDQAWSAEAWTSLRLDQARDIAGAGGEEFSAALLTSSRASIETGLHALSPARFVLHLHFVPVLAEAVRKDGEARLGRMLDGLAWSWVPYARPGAPLATACKSRQAPIMILDRHGVIVSADSVRDVEDRLAKLEARLARRPASAHFRADHPLAKLPPAFPDQAVFLGPRPIAEGLGPIATGPDGMLRPTADASSGARDQFDALALLSQLVPVDAPIAALPEGEAEGLGAWEAEAYRRRLAQAGVRVSAP